SSPTVVDAAAPDRSARACHHHESWPRKPPLRLYSHRHKLCESPGASTASGSGQRRVRGVSHASTPSRSTTMDIDSLSADNLQHVARKQANWAINAFKQFADDRCAAMAASIAFYAAFSLAPTLVMVIAVAGWFFDAAAAGVQTIVENAHHSGSAGGIAAIISFSALAIGASATFSSLNTALNQV